MTQVVLEVLRPGRRPRYHRAERLENGEVLKPESCNTDQTVKQPRVLEALPALRLWPWTQLCRRCWRDTPELEAAQAAEQHYYATAKRRLKPR